MDVFKTLILDTPTVEGATGTVTSVDLAAGTGISVSGGPITSSGSITVTNTSPDQTVALTGGTGISTSGTYPNFTITNDAPDQTVSIAAGTGISTSGTYPSFTVTNSAPDQTVSIAAGTGISVTGSYPSFTVAATGGATGDVVGPASATDNAVVRFDSTTGKLIQDSGVSISDANLLTTTALTVNDNTTLGSSNTDTVTFNARCASEFTPATDNTYDLGGTGHEWRDLYIDGTANIDSLVADTADINGGTIDGATIGASTASSGAFTTASASTSVTTPLVTNAGTLALTATGANVIAASTDGSERMRIDSAGNALVGTTSYFSGGYNAARTYLEIKGSTSTGVLGFATGQADADGNLAGMTEFHDLNSTSGSTRVGYIATRLRGTTANNRGSGIAFAIKTDNSATVTELLHIESTGVGIGTSSPAQALHVVGEIIATGNITAYYSDDRLKTKLGNIENALDKVSKLNGFYYEANETAQALGYKPVREVGLSAQQVEAVLPEVVAPAPIDNEYKTLHYERVIPLLVEAIKELKAEIELLKK